MSFTNKVVLVTGASSGIGAATAVLFAKEGADVAMVGRNQQKLDAVASKVAAVGKKPLIINADVSKDNEAEIIISETIGRFGKLDVLVNIAGFGKTGFILDGSILDAFDTIMKVNLRAVISLTSLAAPYLVSTKGNIVNISSVAALSTPSQGFTAYAVSKAGLDHFTRGAALELASSGVRVNAINPGPVQTDFMHTAGVPVTSEDLQNMTVLNRVAVPDEIADLILYLASEKARGVTGSNFVNDNGYLLK